MHKSSFQSSRLLERRYQQMLEEEQKSLARNKKLLEDIDRLEQQMKYFNHECKQDEVKLDQAKGKFMQYVKSVYPKWTEDLQKWQEAKKLPHYEPEHQFEDPIARSEQIGYSRDMNGSYTDKTGYPKDTIGSSRDMIGYPSDRMGSSSDRMGYPRDRLDYSRDRMSYPSRDRTSFPRDMKGSFREATNLSWDELGFSRGYPKNDIGCPSGGPTMYPQHSPPGMYPHPAHPYFIPTPAYGVPRWSTPGYHDQWSHPHDRRYEEYGKDERQGFSRSGQERPQNVSFERNGQSFERDGQSFERYERGQRAEMQRDVLPNARNGENCNDEREEHYPNQRSNSRDMNSLHQGFSDQLSAESSLDGGRYPASLLYKPSADAARQYHETSQGLGRSNQEAYSQTKRGGESYERSVDSRNFPQRNVSGDSHVEEGREHREARPSDKAQDRSQSGGLFNDREKSHDSEKMERQHQPNKEMNDRMASRDTHISQHSHIEDEKHMQRRNKLDGNGYLNEERTDHTTLNSEQFGKQHKTGGREYLGEPIRDSRLVQLRSEGSGCGSREAMNTDSISLPTIHQYEGDTREIFSDISSSEPLNQDGSSRVDSKHSKVKDYSDNSNSQPHSQGGSSRVESKQFNGKGYSDISKSEQLKQDGTSRVGSDRSKGKDPREFEPKVSQRNEVGTFGNDKRLLTREVSESKASVVEDLIGDDVSDFEVSETELSDDDLGGKEPLGEALASGNVTGETGLAGHEVGGIDSGVRNENMVNDKRARQGGLMNERMDEVGHNDILNDAITGDKATGKGSPSNENMRQQKETGESLPPSRNETKNLSEGPEIRKDTSKDIVREQKVDDQSFSHEDFTHSSNESIPEELQKTDTDDSSSKRKVDGRGNESKIKTDAGEMEVESVEDWKHDAGNTRGMEGESIEDGRQLNEHQEDIERESLTNVAKDFALNEGSRQESRQVENGVQEDEGKIGEGMDKASDGEILSEDEKSKSGVLEDVSFSSGESSSESVPVQEKNASKKSESKTKETMSYSEDFEEERSIPLTQSAAYQKMLSTVDVSDEGEDLEEDFLEGTMSEANTTAQSTHNMPQTLQDSATTSQVKLPAKTSKSKPKLSLFSSGERDDFGNSFGNEGVGALSASWKSSEGTLSPPLSPDAGGYVPSVTGASKVENKQEERKGGKEVSAVDENKTRKVETGKNQPKPQESNTKSRIQAGFWNHSDSESEVDLQISHRGNNNDDDDEFDFYS